VSREFGDADEPERDAFANLRLTRSFEVRAGLFKLPFGRDALTGGANIDFVYRSLAGRQLAPGRDLGVMAHGRLAGAHVAYQAGYFHRDGDNARTEETRGARDALAGRLVVTPLAGRDGALSTLQLGAAVVTSRLDDQLGLRGRTVFGEGVFFDRVFVNGRRLRRGIEAAWANGPVSLAWEHMMVSDQRTGMGAGGADLPSIAASSWYVAGTWVITGERKDGRVEPAHSVFLDGIGALELTARVERLAFDTTSLPSLPVAPPATGLAPNADRAITLGLGWYLNRHLKITGNAVFESVHDPIRSPAPQDGRFPTAVVQFQFAL
jgi:phosphate-selective porin OprO/OprP